MPTIAPNDDDSREVPLDDVWQPRPRGREREQTPTPGDDGGVDLQDFWHAIRDDWRWIAGIGVAVFSLVMGATLMTRMNFASTARLYLGELDTKGRPNGGELDISGGGAQGDVSSELEIIKSRSLVSEAVLNAGLNASIEREGWSRPRFGQWLVSRRDLKLMAGASAEVAVMRAQLADEQGRAKQLTVQLTSASEYDVFSEGEKVAHGMLDVPLKTPVASFTIRQGSQRTPPVGARYELTIVPVTEATSEALARLTVNAPKGGNGTSDLVKVITLEFEHRSPFAAPVFLRELMDAYLARRLSWKTEEARAAEAFVSQQLGVLRESLDATENKLADYRSNTRGVVLDSEAKAIIDQMGKYEEQRVAVRLEVAALSDVKRMLQNPNPPVEAFLVGEASDRVLTGLGEALNEARRRLTELEGRYSPTSSDVVNQKAQISAQLDSIRNYVNGRLGRAQENLGALTKVIKQYEEKLRTVPGAELGLAQLARESDVYSRLYSYMLERQQHAAILKGSTVSKNRVLDAPEIPEKENTPRLGLRLASGVLGLLLGVMVVLLRRFMSSTVKGEGDVRAVARDMPILGKIPERRSLSSKRGWREPPFRALGRDIVLAEAYRTFRTTLYQAGATRKQTVFMVTSPIPGDGKTSTALSLAATLAGDGKWVLVVDADLRKPSHHLLAGYKDDLGLRGVLRGQCDWRDVVQTIQLDNGEFFSIGAGKVGPSELMSNERMARFLVEVRNRYDYVLIDAPSFPLVADALSLAPLVDAVLSVIHIGHTPRGVAAEHVKGLSRVAHDFGIVVNGVASTPVYGYTQEPLKRSRFSLSSLFRARRFRAGPE